MKKSLLIVGAGAGLSLGVARKFAHEGFSVSLISRNAHNLETIKGQLAGEGIEVAFVAADAGNAIGLGKAIDVLSEKVSGFDVVLYNAAVLKAGDILEETSEGLAKDFTINVANALHTLKTAYPGLKKKHGAFLITGGGFGINPDAAYGSLSIGKAGLRSLAYQLRQRLEEDNIYVGLLTVAGLITPESETHSPEALAELFWKLCTDRSEIEYYQ